MGCAHPLNQFMHRFAQRITQPFPINPSMKFNESHKVSSPVRPLCGVSKESLKSEKMRFFALRAECTTERGDKDVEKILHG